MGMAIYLMETTYTNIEQKEIEETQNLIKIQKQKIISDFNYLFEAVEAYPALSDWKNLSSIDKIVEDNGGIPKTEEKSKREAAQFLISDFGFQSFGITLNDGRMYFLEPFKHQSSLSKMNFSDREWFQGVQNTQATYLSDVFISAASENPIVVISTPVFAEDGELLGMWGGSLDLAYLTGFFSDIKKEKSSIFLIDQNNVIIVHSNSSNSDYDELDIIKIVNDNRTETYLHKNEQHIFIEKIEIGNKNWEMVTTISDQDLLPYTISQLKGNYLLITTMTAFIIAAEFLLFHFLKKNLQLNLSISENRKLLIKQERLAAIGELASRVAHDIRNPLSNIRMSLELIKSKSLEERNSEPEINEKFKIAFENIERISHQVNNVLDYVRNRKLAHSLTSLYSCLDNTVQSLYIPDNIKIKYDKTEIRVVADSIQFQIVCNNILTNAIQAIGTDPGEIKIRFSEDSQHVKIEIENSGPSIPDDIMPHIFESLITTKEIGTGLGLASCKRIIENHGGTISVKNNPTTFTITLPKS
jgi:signal transduction histidine kinase